MKRNLQKPSDTQCKTEELNDEKRPKSLSIRTYTVEGFTDAELRRFIKSYTKFAAPLERLESVARDAELMDKSVADLKHLGDLLHKSCASAIEEYEEQLKHNPPEDKGPGKPNGPFIKIGGVKVNAKAVSQYEEEMEILQQIIPADPEERAKFCLTCRAKAAHFDVEWGLEDDSHLLLGTYKHGYGNWELIKSDPDLKLTNKILPVETDKKPQGKELQDRVDYLLHLVKKEKEKKGSVKEKEEIKGKKRKPCAKKEKKTIKGKDEHGNEVSPLRLDKPSEEGEVKEDGLDKSPVKKKQKKENKEDQEKEVAIKKKKEDEKERTKTEDKKEKPKGREAQGGAKGNPSQGPVCIMARSAPILIAEKEEEGNLNVATFDTCKEWMRPVKKALHEMGKLGKGLSVPEQEEHLRIPLLKIGDHISECLKVFTEKEDRALWRWNLWLFVSKFTEFHARKLHWVYQMACRKKAKDKEEKKKEDESKGVRKPLGPEASGTREVSVVPQGPPGPPQKVQQPPPPPPPPPPPQTQGHQSDNYKHPNQRYFRGAEQGYRQDDKFNYYCIGNRAWRWLRHDQYDQPWRKERPSGDRQPHGEPHRIWDNFEPRTPPRKQPYDQYNSDREHWGHRHYYNRYDQDSRRRRVDECMSRNDCQQDFRQMSAPRPPVSYHNQRPSGHCRSFHPENPTDDKKMLPPPPSAQPAKNRRSEPLFVHRSPLEGLYKEQKSQGYNWNWKPRN